MYYTTSGAYRKSKMLIDYATIALTAVIMILFILILFLRSNSGILFPIVFLAGALINGLSGIKAFMNKKRLSGVFLIIAAVILRIVSAAVGLAVLQEPAEASAVKMGCRTKRENDRFLVRQPCYMKRF